MRNDFLPGRSISKRTVDKDYGLGSQSGSRSWDANRGHRGQEETQPDDAFEQFHSCIPSLMGTLVLHAVVLSAKQSSPTNDTRTAPFSRECRRIAGGPVDRSASRLKLGNSSHAVVDESREEFGGDDELSPLRVESGGGLRGNRVLDRPPLLLELCDFVAYRNEHVAIVSQL